VVNAGEGASFNDFARVALTAAALDFASIEAVSMSTLKRPAARPRNSRLRCLLSEAIDLPDLPSWREAVRDFVAGGSAIFAADAPEAHI